MTNNQEDSLQEKAEKIFFEYLDSVQQGMPPDKTQILERYPDLRDLLEKKFKAFEIFQTGLRAAKGGASFSSLNHQEQITVQFPHKFANFELLTELGIGGMGKVFLARQISLNRIVALKVLNPMLLINPKSIQRFKREAETVAKLRHQSIVPIFEFETKEGSYFIALDFIAGMTLDKIVKRVKKSGLAKLSGSDIQIWIKEYLQTIFEKTGKIANISEIQKKYSNTEQTPLTHWSYTEFACCVIAQIAEALSYAHSCGVVHRDVKPSNIIVAPDGNAYLLDFGITKSLEVSQLEMTSDFLGTIYYSSPEQIESPESVAASSDIFSLGATFYELLTLEKPFDGKTIHQVGEALKKREPTAPRELNPHISKDLETIILKALEKSPAKRYDSANSFHQDIVNFLEYKPIIAKPPALPDRVYKFVRRNLAVSVATAVVFIGIVSALWFSYQKKISEKQVKEEQFEKLLNEASYLIAMLKDEDALVKLNEAKKIFPDNPKPHIKEAELYLLHKKYDKAESLLYDLLSAHPKNNHIKRVLGRTLALAHKYKEAETVSREIINNEMDNDILLEAYELLAGSLEAMNKSNEAIEVAHKAIAISSVSYSANLFLALSYGKIGDYKMSIKHYEVVFNNAKSVTDMVLAASEIARSYEKLKDYRKAIEWYKVALTLHPQDYHSRGMLAFLYEQLKDYSSAIKEWETLGSLFPDNATAYKNLGTTLFMAKRYDEARIAYEKALLLGASDYTIYSSLAFLYEKDAEYEKAEKLYKKSLALNPNDSFATKGLERSLFVKQISKDNQHAGEQGNGFIGVQLDDKISNSSGVVIAQVLKGYPAESAGLQRDDIITAVNNIPVRKTYQIITSIRKRTNISTPVHVFRDGKLLKFDVTPIEKNETQVTHKTVDKDMAINGYRNAEYGFTISPPEGWNYAENVYRDSILRQIVSFYDPQVQKDVRPDISVTIFYQETFMPDEIIRQLRNDTNKFNFYFDILSEKNITFKKMPAKEYLISATLGKIKIKNITRLIYKSGITYRIVCASDLEDFEKYQYIFEKTLNSFE